jgi:hypothetical protein
VQAERGNRGGQCGCMGKGRAIRGLGRVWLAMACRVVHISLADATGTGKKQGGSLRSSSCCLGRVLRGGSASNHGRLKGSMQDQGFVCQKKAIKAYINDM